MLDSFACFLTLFVDWVLVIMCFNSVVISLDYSFAAVLLVKVYCGVWVC